MGKTIERKSSSAKNKETSPVNSSFGAKRICPSCTGRFYDLGKNPATCPSCKHSFDPTIVLRARRGRKKAEAQAAAAARAAAKKKELSLEDIEIEVEDVGEPVEEIVEIEAADDLEDIEEDIETLDDHHPHSTSDGDDADDETIMEELGDEALIGELDSEDGFEEEEEDEDAPKKKGKAKPKKPAAKKR